MRENGTYSDTYQQTSLNPFGNTIAFTTMLAGSIGFLAYGNSDGFRKYMRDYLVKSGVRRSWHDAPANMPGNKVFEDKVHAHFASHNYVGDIKAGHYNTMIAAHNKEQKASQLGPKTYPYHDALITDNDELARKLAKNKENHMLTQERLDRFAKIEKLHSHRFAHDVTPNNIQDPTVDHQVKQIRSTVNSAIKDALHSEQFNKTIDDTYDILNIINRDLRASNLSTFEVESIDSIFSEMSIKVTDLNTKVGSLPVIDQEEWKFSKTGDFKVPDAEHFPTNFDLSDIKIKHILDYQNKYLKKNRLSPDAESFIKTLASIDDGKMTAGLFYGGKGVPHITGVLKKFAHVGRDNVRHPAWKQATDLLNTWKTNKSIKQQVYKTLEHLGTSDLKYDKYVKEYEIPASFQMSNAAEHISGITTTQNEIMDMYRKLKATLGNVLQRSSVDPDLSARITSLLNHIDTVHTDLGNSISNKNEELTSKLLKIKDMVALTRANNLVPTALQFEYAKIQQEAASEFANGGMSTEITKKLNVTIGEVLDAITQTPNIPAVQKVSTLSPERQPKKRAIEVYTRAAIEQSRKIEEQQILNHARKREVGKFRTQIRRIMSPTTATTIPRGTSLEQTLDKVVEDAIDNIDRSFDSSVKRNVLRYMAPTDSENSTTYKPTERLTKEGRYFMEHVIKDANPHHMHVSNDWWTIRTAFVGKGGMTEDVNSILKTLKAQGISDDQIHIYNTNDAIAIKVGKLDPILVQHRWGGVTKVGNQAFIMGGIEGEKDIRSDRVGIRAAHDHYINVINNYLTERGQDIRTSVESGADITFADGQVLSKSFSTYVTGQHKTIYGPRGHKVAISSMNSITQVMGMLLETQNPKIGRAYSSMGNQYFEKQILLKEAQINHLRGDRLGNIGTKAQHMLAVRELEQQIHNLKNRQKMAAEIPFDPNIVVDRFSRQTEAIYNYSTDTELSMEQIYQTTRGSMMANYYGVRPEKALKGIMTWWNNISPYFNKAKGSHSLMNAVPSAASLHLPSNALDLKVPAKDFDVKKIGYRVVSGIELSRLENLGNGNYGSINHAIDMLTAEAHGHYLQVNMHNDYFMMKESFAEKFQGYKTKSSHIKERSELYDKIGKVFDKMNNHTEVKNVKKVFDTTHALLHSGMTIKAEDLAHNSVGKEFYQELQDIINKDPSQLDPNLQDLYFKMSEDERLKPNNQRLKIKSITVNGPSIKVDYYFQQNVSPLTKWNHPMSGKGLTMIIPDRQMPFWAAQGILGHSAESEHIKKLADSIRDTGAKIDIIGSADTTKGHIAMSYFDGVMNSAKDEIWDKLSGQGLSAEARMLKTEGILKSFAVSFFDPSKLSPAAQEKLKKISYLSVNEGHEAWRVLALDLVQADYETLLKNNSGKSAAILDIYTNESVSTAFGDAGKGINQTKVVQIANSMRDVLSDVGITSPAKQQEFINHLFDKAAPAVEGGVRLMTGLLRMVQMNQSTYEMYRIATGKTRALGGAINGVKYDPWSLTYLRNKGLDTRANMLQAQMASASDTVNMYMSSIHKMNGVNPAHYLDPKFMSGIGAINRVQVLTPEKMRDMKELHDTSAISHINKYDFLVHGLTSKDTHGLELEAHFSDKLIGAAAGTTSFGDDSDVSYDTVKAAGQQMEDAELHLKRINTSKSIKENFETANTISATMTNEYSNQYQRYLKEFKSLELPVQVRIPGARDAITSINYVGMSEEFLTDTSMDAMKLNRRVDLGDGRGPMAMDTALYNRVLASQKKITTKTVLYQHWKEHDGAGKVGTKEDNDALDEIRQDVVEHYYLTHHGFQNIFRGQMKQGQLNSVQMFGKSGFNIDTVHFRDNETLKRVFDSVNNPHLGGEQLVTPKTGYIAMDKETFVRMMTPQYTDKTSRELAEGIMKGNIITSGIFSRQPSLFDRSYDAMQLQLFDAGQMAEAGKLKYSHVIDMRQTMYINRLDALVKRGDFDSDIYNFAGALKKSYVDENMDALSSYAREHSLMLKKLEGPGYEVQVRGTGSWVRQHFSAMQEATAVVNAGSAEAAAHSSIKKGTNLLFMALKQPDIQNGQLISIHDSLQADYEKTRKGVEIIDKDQLVTMPEKFNEMKISTAKAIYELTDAEYVAGEKEHKGKDLKYVDHLLSNVYMLKRDSDIAHKMNMKSEWTVGEHGTVENALRAFSQGNLHDVEASADTELRTFLDNNVKDKNLADSIYRQLHNDIGLTSRQAMANIATRDRELVGSFVNVKGTTGVMFNYAHAVIQEAAAKFYPNDSAARKAIGMLSWVPQQINISSKKLLPGMATSFMDTLNLAVSTRNGSDEAGNVLIRGDVYLRQDVGTGRFLRENNDMISHLEARIKDTTDGLNGLSKKEVGERLAGYRATMDKHMGKYNKLIDAEHGDISEFLLSEHADQMDMKVNLLHEMQGTHDSNYLTGRNVGEEISILRETSKQIKTTQALMVNGADAAGFGSAQQGHTRDFLDRFQEHGGIDKMFRSVGQQLLSNRSMDFFSNGNTLRKFAQLTYGRDTTEIGELFASINNMKAYTEKITRTRTTTSSSFMDRSMQSFTSKMENSKNGVIRGVMDHVNMSDLHGRGAGFVGLAALVGGFIGVIAASPSDREWLGPSAGTGGEYFDTASTRDERHYANKENQRELARDGRGSFRQGHGVARKVKARVSVDELPNRYGKFSDYFRELSGNRGNTYDSRITNAQKNQQSNVNYWG